jgi:hypothetical protein
MMTAYERSKIHSEETLSALRAKIAPLLPSGEVAVTCGSYARREASANSDVDFFVITKGTMPSQCLEGTDPPAWWSKVRDKIKEVVEIEPAEGGAFSQFEHHDEMLRNIGGDKDTNQKITRRILFLLEGDWLGNQSGLESIRREVLEKYIAESMTDHQLALFLLNDIVRYYRTICVDYEFKTSQGMKPKPWGIRNIKLVFSRKLLYASGIFSIAQTADCRRDRKLEVLETLFKLPVVDRMQEICGVSNMRAVLASYNHFLEKMEDPTTREHLINLKKENRVSDPIFRDLKNEGHKFTRELLQLLENTFDSSHPIHRAIVF